MEGVPGSRNPAVLPLSKTDETTSSKRRTNAISVETKEFYIPPFRHQPSVLEGIFISPTRLRLKCKFWASNQGKDCYKNQSPATAPNINPFDAYLPDYFQTNSFSLMRASRVLNPVFSLFCTWNQRASQKIARIWLLRYFFLMFNPFTSYWSLFNYWHFNFIYLFFVIWSYKLLIYLLLAVECNDDLST